MPTLVTKPLITLDGNLSDWTSADAIENPANNVPGYTLYGTVQNDTYLIGFEAVDATDPVIGAGTTIWLNTDQNTATGYSPFDAIGADYNVTFDAAGVPYLYTGAAGQTLVSSTPLTCALSSDGRSLEIAIPRSLVTPTGGAAPTSIDIAAVINNVGGNSPAAIYLPGDYNSPEYAVTDPATLPAPTEAHKVAIVYSETSANLYCSQTAYTDLFMAAQNQARMAGVSYDVIDESKLTDINNLVGYDALIFPAMADVNTAQLPAIMSTLTSAVQNYHISIITAGDFLTNDQTGAPLPGNSYANMEALLGLTRASGGNSGDVTVTANDVGNPIMKGYTAGQVIQTYTGEGYTAYTGFNTATDVLVNQNVAGVGTLPGVIETTTGGTNVHFATADLLGDSNLLSDAIQSVVLGTQAGVALHISRDAGAMVARMDMDQSQFPSEVSPSGGGLGIYDKLIPILQQWNQQYDFVGSFYINIGDNAADANDPTATDWAKSLAYYKAILAMGSEIGNHSYTHLINPPIETFTATTVGDTPAGSTQITLSSMPSFAGVTVGMTVTGLNLGSNTPLPGAAGEGGAVANTTVTAVSGGTITISYIPGGYGTGNDGVLGDIPAGTTLTFGIPAENTNFLQTGTGTVTGSDGDPFTYDYEFNQSKTLAQTQLGTTIYGAAIPGANETYATDRNILPYYQSVAPGGSVTGYTGYLTGGWTGIGAGYPSAIGYMSPADQGALYIAPNVTFDFTEIQYQGKTVAQAEADWAAQLQSLAANAAGTPIVVWPVHDYGVTAWDTSDSGAASPYTTQMYADFIAKAVANGYEFVTMEDLASRIVAQEKATINCTTSGNVITATITPDASAPDLGAMALDVINGGTDVIASVTNWYAYNAQELFLPRNGGTFAINLGATQDDVTHITSLPMRGDLLSVTGDGLDLNFAMIGTGRVNIDLGPCGTITPIVTGATIVSLVGDQLDLMLSGTGEHDVSICLLSSVTAVAFSADRGASASDFITNVAAQTITGTLNAALPVGGAVQVSLDNGATWLSADAASGSAMFTLTGVTLTGSNTLLARVSSIGLTGPVFSHAYVLDQTAPAAPTTPDLVSASDTGSSNIDNITKLTTPTFAGTAEAGSTVTLLDGATVIGTGTAVGGSWRITASTLAAGTHTVMAEATDVAGNMGALSAALLVTVATSIATPSAPDLVAASDSGVSSTDNITNVTKPTCSGTAQAGATVTLYDGTKIMGSGVATGGTWTVTASSVLASGTHSITAKALDLAGNVSATSPALSFTIDTTAPAAPSKPDLATASDSGVSNTDDITSVTKPTFGGTAEAGSSVTLYDGTAVIGTGVATGGNWSIATASSLANGTHSITAKATDVAGNVSAASGMLSVTIDAAAPSVPHFASISGNSLAVALSGSGDAGSTVSILNGTTILGTTTVNTGGSWSWSFINLGFNSVTSLTAVASDAAGNKSGSSGSALVGTSRADTLTSTAGNDVMLGAGGADKFVFSSLFGHDLIADFAASGLIHDVLNFRGISALNSYASVMSHATQVGAGTVITLDNNDVLTLANVTRSNLTASDFTFA